MSGDGAMSASDVVHSVGSDMTVTVAWAVAQELISGAREMSMSDSELVSVVFLLSVLLSSLPEKMGLVWGKVAPESVHAHGQSLFDFLYLFMEVANRVSLSVCVQIVTESVHSEEITKRTSRLVNLFTVSIFFIFISSVASRSKRSQL